VSFIRCTNAALLPIVQSASTSAMLFADGTSRASRACRSVSTSPSDTGSSDSLPALRRTV